MSYEGKSAQRRSTQKSLVAGADATVRRELPSVAGAAITVPKAGADDMWQALTEEQGVARVWLDGRFKAPADEHGAKAGEAGGGVAQIGAPAAWAAGYDGKGVNVAVLDTGVDTRAVVIVGRPVPGNRHDSRGWEESGARDAVGHTTTIADGGYQGTGLVIPHRRAKGKELPGVRAGDECVLGMHCAHWRTGRVR